MNTIVYGLLLFIIVVGGSYLFNKFFTKIKSASQFKKDIKQFDRNELERIQTEYKKAMRSEDLKSRQQLIDDRIKSHKDKLIIKITVEKKD